ncbi:MAG: hypothetical protein J6Q32_01395 [Clostridia bacterium]|nr:hypothetical protein [Clostridia bacterium]
MKTFKFKFMPIVKVLLVLIMAIALFGLAFNLYNLVSFVKANLLKTEKLIASIVFIVITILLIIFSVSVFFSSKYSILENKVLLKFGFFKTKYLISEILCFTHFKKSDKLVCYFKNGEYTVINVDSKAFQDFVSQIKTANPDILFNDNFDETNA